jgi:nucleoside-diphosphate-sugar epimerase
MVAATENLLDAAAKEKSVRRFVLTSSSAAAFIPFPDKEVVVDTGK